MTKVEKDIRGYLWPQSTYLAQRQDLSYYYDLTRLYGCGCWTLKGQQEKRLEG